jgi:hypothetical protein
MQNTDEREPYRDDVRTPLHAAGWRETAETTVVAPNGALWAETNNALDSGIDAPDRTWSVSFDSNVPAGVIVAAALAASGVDVPALIAENRRLTTRNAALKEDAATLRALEAAGVDNWEGYGNALAHL